MPLLFCFTTKGSIKSLWRKKVQHKTCVTEQSSDEDATIPLKSLRGINTAQVHCFKLSWWSAAWRVETRECRWFIQSGCLQSLLVFMCLYFVRHWFKMREQNQETRVVVKYVYWTHVVLELFLIFRVLKISGKEFYIVFQRTQNSLWHSQIGLLCY